MSIKRIEAFNARGFAVTDVMVGSINPSYGIVDTKGGNIYIFTRRDNSKLWLRPSGMNRTMVDVDDELITYGTVHLVEYDGDEGEMLESHLIGIIDE